MEGYPKLKLQSMSRVAEEIKKRIKSEIGEWITVSIGIAPNRYLAKIAAGLHKPDGLDEINKENFLRYLFQAKIDRLDRNKRKKCSQTQRNGYLFGSGFLRSARLAA